jgi:hypothetical protein
MSSVIAESCNILVQIESAFTAQNVGVIASRVFGGLAI